MGITVEDVGRGTYTLMMFLKEPCRLKIGALGELYFNEGYYAYTGSALGGGGFARVRRHRAVASGKNKVKQWHIDYFLPYVEVLEVATSPRPECTVASGIDRHLARVPGFGCSDCRCPTHLHYSEGLEKMKKAVHEAHHVA
jgi:Uri superfamily endonuclease